MPNPSSAIETSTFQRLLVLGGPKVGKTTTIISTCERPVYVINSDDKFSLRPAARVCDFTWDLALGDDLQAIEKCIHEARLGVKEGKYKTVVWDTITSYSDRALEVYESVTKESQGKFWYNHRKHVLGVLDRLFALKCHIVVTCHHLDIPDTTTERQVRKAGEGAVGAFPGQLRIKVPAAFQDIVFLEKRAGKRTFITSSSGVFGPGCRNLPEVESCDADVGVLWKLMKGGGDKKGKK
jgi:signal recognition particle receptor subunit beta